MTEFTPTDVLASIGRLRGASIDEVAADLGVAVADVLPKLSELVELGYVRPLGRGIPVMPNGAPLLDKSRLSESAFEVTFRGFVELRSS
jgi:predicted transcriptional regulator